MLSLQAWKSLRRPIQHPLYGYFYNAIIGQKSVGAIVSNIINGNVIFELLALLIAISICFFSWLLAFAVIAFLPVIIPAIGTYHGLNSALKISNTLSRERRTGRYDLLAISPLGSDGTHWFIASAVSVSNSALKQTVDVSRAIFVFTGFGLSALILMRPLLPHNGTLFDALIDSILTTLPFVIVMIAIVWDFIQSNVIGTLLGMLIPTYSKQEIESGGLILGLYLLLQVSFYVTVALLAFFGFAVLNARFDLRMSAIILSSVLLLLLALREFGLTRGWKLLSQRLDVEKIQVPSEYSK